MQAEDSEDLTPYFPLYTFIYALLLQNRKSSVISSFTFEFYERPPLGDSCSFVRLLFGNYKWRYRSSDSYVE